MRHTAAALLLLALLAGTLTGCQKYTLDKETTYTFLNGLDESVTLNIYQSKADYNNATNAWQQLTLPAHGQQAFTMEIGKTYYVDWYNANGQYTNWMPTNSGSTQVVTQPAPQLSISAKPQTITLSQNYPSYDRYLLLPGNSTSSTWQVIGLYTGSSQLNPAPYVQFKFNKDFTGSIRYQVVSTNDTAVLNCQYYNYNNSSLSNYLSLYLYPASGGNGLAQCTYEPSYPYPPTSRDTLSCSLNFYNNGSTYVMVRQP